MKKIFTLAFLKLSLVTITLAQTTIASWTFEGVSVSATAGSTPSLTAGSTLADAGALTAGSAFSAFHTNAATVFSTPAGNGSAKALSSNTWSVGDYYQFKVATTGYTAISLAWDQTGSNTGPAPFKVQYSVTPGGASGYVDVNTYTIPNNPASTPTAGSAFSWAAATPITSTSFTSSLSSITAVNNQSEVYFRLVCTATTPIGATATFGTGGTNRIDNFSVISNPSIPVEMTYFKGQNNGNTVKLTWQTASEKNNSFFEVQRSANGTDFAAIGTVKGNGYAQALTDYFFIDEAPLAGLSYYRLRQVDYDGANEFSKIVSINSGKGANTTLKVYPTVTKGVMYVEMDAVQAESALVIADMSGRIVKSQLLTEGSSVQTVDVSELPNGMYFVRLSSQSVNSVYKIVKQ